MGGYQWCRCNHTIAVGVYPSTCDYNIYQHYEVDDHSLFIIIAAEVLWCWWWRTMFAITQAIASVLCQILAFYPNVLRAVCFDFRSFTGSVRCGICAADSLWSGDPKSGVRGSHPIHCEGLYCRIVTVSVRSYLLHGRTTSTYSWAPWQPCWVLDSSQLYLALLVWHWIKLGSRAKL